MKSDFFYSKSAGLYVCTKPLKIDSRVKKAAEKNKIKMGWDDEGRINNIDFDNAKKLLKGLGAIMMTPTDYWKVMRDAKQAGNKEMAESLASDRFCEWLDRVYLENGNSIDYSDVVGKYKYSGKKEKAFFPHGRPGWMNPENNIDYAHGMPKKVELFREKHATSWKYWSPDFSVTKIGVLAPIRGYVTSVGKPSLDLGIPVDAEQPMLMIRECRKIPLELPIKQEILDKAEKMLKLYSGIGKSMQSLKNKKKYDLLYSKFNQYMAFLMKHGKLFNKSKELIVYKLREQLIDLLGLIKVIALSKNDMKKAEQADMAAELLTGAKNKKIDYEDFVSFIKTSKERLEKALKENTDIVFVMGHKNPDSDTAVTCLFEALRNSILDEGKITYIPIIQNYKIPDEVRRLLGDEVSDSILLHSNKMYEQAKKTGLARWISVDQNREPEVQKYFIAMVDHHLITEIAKHQDIPKTLEMTGSCTALVVQKLLGSGISLAKETARILYGAALMDTENRVKHKMTAKDAFLMDYLKKISETHGDSAFYSELMSCLLNTDDADILFKRDYKEDWGFGFAVTKIKNGFDKKGNVLKQSLVKRSVDLAKQNNIEKNLPLTVLRITDYEEDNKTVNRERVYLIFNKQSSKEFIRTIFDLIEMNVKFEFASPKLRIRKTNEFVEFWGTGLQLSRKKTAPVLEPVVGAFNEYFYSPTTRLWIRRNFLKKTNDAKKAAKHLKLKLSTDKDNRLNYITYPEARHLTKKLGYSILSLRKYWLALNDAKKIKDVQMIDSLQGSNFVEFLDTAIKNCSSIIEHPEITKKGKKYILTGKKQKVTVPKGKPGLIHPNEIDLKTGLPKIVRKPNEYGNPELWRYWEPDADLVIPTRSYIFLMKQPCWDGKFHITDSFPNLGIRPCCKNVKPPKIEINTGRDKLTVRIKKEGDIVDYKWIK